MKIFLAPNITVTFSFGYFVLSFEWCSLCSCFWIENWNYKYKHSILFLYFNVIFLVFNIFCNEKFHLIFLCFCISILSSHIFLNFKLVLHITLFCIIMSLIPLTSSINSFLLTDQTVLFGSQSYYISYEMCRPNSIQIVVAQEYYTI